MKYTLVRSYKEVIVVEAEDEESAVNKGTECPEWDCIEDDIEVHEGEVTHLRIEGEYTLL